MAETEPVVAIEPILDDPESPTPEVTAGNVTAGLTDPEPKKKEPAKPAQPESFIDPASLPEELKPHWKRMHGAYTKRLEGLTARKADLDFLDQYRGNPEIARQVLQQEAARLGLTLIPAGSQPPKGTENGSTPPDATGDTPPQLVQAIAARLQPELQWMAQSLADAQWEAHRLTVAPLVQRERTKEAQSRGAEYQQLAAQLAAQAPGWEEHEEAMTELLNFLRSPNLTHPTFGSKIALLHGVVTKDARARVAAAESMGTAARNRSATGGSARSTTTNVPERVRGAKTTAEAFRIAAEEAELELERQGVTVS